MPSNTTYTASRMQDLDKNNLALFSQGVSGTAFANTTTNIDLLLTDDAILTGIYVITNGGSYGDKISIQVIDIAGTYFPANTVIATAVSNWYVPPNINFHFSSVFPQKLLTSLTIRVSYTSNALLGSVFVGMNYELQKVLT